MAQETYIYALRDPRDGSFRYIGKADDPQKRFKQHLESRGRIRNLVEELAAIGLTLQLYILQKCAKHEWPLWEQYWIGLGFMLKEKLLNLRPGGENPPIQTGNAWRGRKHTAESRVKMRAAKIGKHPPNFGKKMSTETIEKNRSGHLGIRHSEGTRLKMSDSARGKNTWSRGRKCTEEHRRNVSLAVKEWWQRRRQLCK